ncbi:MAG TPA: aminoglycoside phosphotransferase [Deltaproteobacteria bacterium]|nr:aminoglycoside phosphotransferase [Deltaproteobacteria bacterium]
MDFAALDQKEQVERLSRLASCALSAWDLPSPQVALLKYRENAVFAVTASDGARAVLRVHRPGYHSDGEIRSEVAWMRALDAAGIPTPTIIDTRAGDVLTTVAVDSVPEARQCDLMAWVDGRPPGTLEAGVVGADEAVRALYRAVGELAARMHAHAASWKHPESFCRPSWDAETLVGDNPTFGRFWELEVLTDSQRPIVLAARDRVRERLTALGPANALIHGDLVPDNILVDGARTRVIDFDDCGWSWVAFELATSIFSLQISGRLEVGLEGYLDGYRRVRSFPEYELAWLPDLLVARGLSYLGWPVGRPEIHSMRPLLPFLAGAITDACQSYLTGAGAGESPL